MREKFRETLDYLARLTGTVKAIYALYNLWQIAQMLPMFHLLDPLKGKWAPFLQVGAMLTAVLGLGIAQGRYSNRREYPRKRLVRNAMLWGSGMVLLFLLSMNLYYDLPESWFIGWSWGRWMATLLVYWGFGGALGVTATLINELAKSGRPPARPG